MDTSLLTKCMIFNSFRALGFDYLLNPQTNELHLLKRGCLSGSHNLMSADIQNFVGIQNLGLYPIHLNPDGTRFSIYAQVSNYYIGEYQLNKCKHCFPKQGRVANISWSSMLTC